ncbi:hypothetical protein L228DRAFT_269129 [Xylona heveae TC161]|uniref:Uncharacterized protein n=1 Tax=Xylona heveae (strain CBS 132557 / TC161) TaxID=1328760 RepID=A0A165G2K9_XYLHT|nr:hypothetical protein L228DRAFT_269129 [Xylona heveae TC161]KZF21666.1 hypothetical protein L228DRAFT_269129 [Xylona heveae TC161]
MAATSQTSHPHPDEISHMRRQSYTAPVGSPALSPSSTNSGGSSGTDGGREGYFHAPVPQRPHMVQRLRSFTQLHRSRSQERQDSRDSRESHESHEHAHDDEHHRRRSSRRSRSRSRSPVTESSLRARDRRYPEEEGYAHDEHAHVLPHISAANFNVRSHNRKRPKMAERPRSQGTYTDCGRHANDWLFGGFSVTGTVRHWLKDEGKH